MASGLGDRAQSVLCDSSATVTVVMKKGEKLSAGDIKELFASSSKKQAQKWKPASFRKNTTDPAVVQYVVKFSAGST